MVEPVCGRACEAVCSRGCEPVWGRGCVCQRLHVIEAVCIRLQRLFVAGCCRLRDQILPVNP